jgi:hypothetical protein
MLARRGFWTEGCAVLESARALLPGAPAGTETLTDPSAVAVSPTGADRYQSARRALSTQVRAVFSATLAAQEAGIRKLRRWAKFVLGALAASALLSAIPGWFIHRDLTVGAQWTASSGENSEPTSGTFVRHGPFDSYPGHFFQTADQASPHLDIDLGAPHTVHSVTVVNRSDCCLEHARGLVILTSQDGVDYQPAASRDPRSFFRRWSAAFSSRRARYLRLQLPRQDRLALADVRVYGR